MENELEFKEFLIRAKINTYVGNGPKSLPSRPHSMDLSYKDGDYLYIDSYIGDKQFIGEEVVWYKGKIFWGMNYYGKCIVENVPEDFEDFLKEALKHITSSAPLRGPEYLKKGDFKYRSRYKGDMTCFRGEEEVLFKGNKIYYLMFHGGTLG